ncbi:hypothetical protein D9619_011851 [Psilocybe cf. subviscida]|uniref:SET domain-containing protein n=1 Tax=Psilocybe cf. subviscida TaxID=2480587 RepID=A0A8H5B0K1_9AGAR|nr:hypothetical protein D9619_011851 [Psilocybe cf. subviscida]
MIFETATELTVDSPAPCIFSHSAVIFIMETIDEDFELSNTDAAARLLNDLWMLFYSWEQNYCYDTLLPSLRSSEHQPPPNLPAAEIGASWEVCATVADAELLEDGYWEVEDINFDAVVRTPCQPISIQRHSTASAAPHAKVVPLEPYPNYTSCAPASRNVLVKGSRHLRAQFAPFADDPNFDLVRYLRDFEDFAWQNNYDDPDYEIILCEWTRQLYFNHHFPLNELDNIVFNFTELYLRHSNRNGLIWDIVRRDYPTWVWPRPDKDVFPLFYPQLQAIERERERLRAEQDPDNASPNSVNHIADSLLDHLRKDAPDSCANINCMLVRCAHGKHPRKLIPSRGEEIWKENQRYWAEVQHQNTSGMRNRKKKKETDIMAKQRKELEKWRTRRTPCSSECWLTVKDKMISGPEGLLTLINNWGPTETAEIHQLMKLAGADGGPCEWAVICRKSCAELYAEHARVYPTNPVGDSDTNQMDVDVVGSRLASLALNASIDEFRTAPATTPDHVVFRRLAHATRADKDVLARAVDAAALPGKLAAWIPGNGANAILSFAGVVRVFVARKIVDILSEYTRTEKEVQRERKNPAITGCTIDAWAVGNETRYLNHSSSPNCRAGTRKIRRGEELTLDYGPLYWKNAAPVEDDEDEFGSEGTLNFAQERELEDATISDFDMTQRSASDTEMLEYTDGDN